MAEINIARYKAKGTSFSANLYDSHGWEKSSSYTQVTTANDAATGLFYLRDLNGSYGYTLTSTPAYWLASPAHVVTYGAWNLFLIDSAGGFSASADGPSGLRPVVTLTTVSNSDIVGD